MRGLDAVADDCDCLLSVNGVNGWAVLDLLLFVPF